MFLLISMHVNAQYNFSLDIIIVLRLTSVAASVIDWHKQAMFMLTLCSWIAE